MSRLIILAKVVVVGDGGGGCMTIVFFGFFGFRLKIDVMNENRDFRLPFVADCVDCFVATS